MNAISQHIPAFVETDQPPKQGEFSTIDELLRIPFVARWATEKTFHRFSQHHGSLIVELRGGREWWVVGFLKNKQPDLPEWDHGIYELWDENRKPIEIPGTQVKYSCGGEVGLIDGRILRDRRR